jgi:hypothetical protein
MMRLIVGEPGALSQPSLGRATTSLLTPVPIAVFAASGMAIVLAVAAGASVAMTLSCAGLGLLAGIWRRSAAGIAMGLGALWICLALQNRQAADWEDARRGARVLAEVRFSGLVTRGDAGC